MAERRYHIEIMAAADGGHDHRIVEAVQSLRALGFRIVSMASGHKPPDAVLDAAKLFIDRAPWEMPIEDYLRSWGMSEEEAAGIISRCRGDPALRVAFLQAVEKTP